MLNGVFRFVVGFVLVLGVMLGGVWIATGSDFFLYRWLAPRQEAVRRQTFEESKAYNQGMIQEIQNMQFAYFEADAEHKKALASIILHRVADYDVSKFPIDLQQFIEQLRKERTGVSP